MFLLVTSNRTGAEDFTFEEVATGFRPTSLDISPDGKHVYASTSEEGRLCVIEITTGDIVATVSVPGLSCVLPRGNRVFVSSRTDGIVVVLDTADNWSLLAQIPVGTKQVDFLSAPGGQHFDGVILASCSSGIHTKIVRVDVKSGLPKDLLSERARVRAVVGRRGRSVLLHSHSRDRYGSGGRPRVYLYRPFLEGTSADADPFGNLSKSGLDSLAAPLNQLHDRPFLTAGRSPWFGFPPCRGPTSKQVLYACQDANDETCFYALETVRLVARSADLARRELWSVPVPELPRGMSFRSVSELCARTTAAVAATSRDRLHVYVITPWGCYRGSCVKPERAPAAPSPQPVVSSLVKPLTPPAAFQPLETTFLPTAFAVSEDGTKLFVAGEDNDVVFAYAVMSGEPLWRIDVTCPACLVSRGNRLFVANGAAGEISEFDCSGSSEQVATYRLDLAGVPFMHASRSPYFDGKLLISGPPGYGTNRGHSWCYLLLDTASAGVVTFSSDGSPTGPAQFSYDGTHVAVQDIFNGTMACMPTAQFQQAGADWSGTARANWQARHLLWQTAPSGFWLGPGALFYGDPPKQIQVPGQPVLIPDLTAHRVYGLMPPTIASFSLDLRLGELARNPVIGLPQHAFHLGWFRPGVEPVAVTIGNKTLLHVLCRGPDNGLPRIYRGVMPAPAPAEQTEADPVAREAPVDELRFAEVDLRHEPGQIAAGEDGKTLLVACPAAGRLLVLDAASGRVQGETALRDPRDVLVRGSTVAVASPASGSVHIYTTDAANDMLKAAGTVCLGKPGPIALTAPRGRNFQNRVYATLDSSGTDDVTTRAFMINTEAGSAKLLPVPASGFECPFRLVSNYRGTRLVRVSELDEQLLRVVATTGKLEPMQGYTAKSHIDDPLGEQTSPSLVWPGGRTVWHGMPPRPLPRDENVLVVGDLTRELLYVFTDRSEFVALTNDSRLEPAAARTVVGLPDSCRACLAPPRTMGLLPPSPRLKKRTPSVAVTMNGVLHVYTVVAPTRGRLASLYHGVSAAVPTPEGAPEGAHGESAEGATATIQFRPVRLSVEPKGFTISPGGDRLHIVNDEEDRVIVLDSLSGEPATAIATPSPVAVLEVDGRLYVANHGHGTISVFSRDDGWALHDELLVGHDGILSMVPVPAGPAAGQFLATAAAVNQDRNVLGLYLVDPVKDEHLLIRDDLSPGWLAIGSDGSTVALAEPPSHSMLRVGRGIEFKPGTRWQEWCPSLPYACGLLSQPAGSPLWLGETMVLAGRVPQPLDLGERARIVEVRGEKTFLRLAEDEATAYSLDLALRETGRCRTAGLPALLSERAERDRWSSRLPLERLCPYGRRAVGLLRDGVLQCYVIAVGPDGIQRLYRGVSAFPLPRTSSTAVAATGGTQPGRLPESVSVGQEVTVDLGAGGGARSDYRLIRGPEGLVLSQAGIVSWRPSADHVGEHSIKIRTSTPAGVEILRYQVEVREPDTSVAADPAPGRLFLEVRMPVLCAAADDAGLWVIEGDTGILLTGGAMDSAVRIPMPFDVSAAKTRGDSLIVAGGGRLALVKSSDGSVVRTVDLCCDAVRDLALAPEEPFAYVATYETPVGQDAESRVGTSIVKRVDETTGQMIALNEVLATKLAFHPGGRRLYAGLSAVSYDRKTVVGILGSMRTWATETRIDALLEYAVSPMAISLRSANPNPGRNIAFLGALPDGSGVCCLTRQPGEVGSPNASGTAIPVFDAGNVTRCSYAFRLGDKPRNAALHPYLPLAAVTDGTHVEFFDTKTGGRVAPMIDETNALPGSISHIAFMPPGKHLVAIGQDGIGRTVAWRLPLDLTPAETECLGRPVEVKPVELVPTPSIAADRLHSLRKARGTAELTSVQIPRQCAPSVVVIRTGNSHGTGFFVGDEGYVLTCAHVAPSDTRIRVSYLRTSDALPLTAESQETSVAKVLGRDAKTDLALLKMDVKHGEGRALAFADAKAVSTGTRVYAVGNPGLGGEVLTHTVTTGIVSNAQRLLDGTRYIQTDAAVNPGSSGGPLLDSCGNVIGLVTAKGDIEAAGFAVPVDQLVAFLKEFVK